MIESIANVPDLREIINAEYLVLATQLDPENLSDGTKIAAVAGALFFTSLGYALFKWEDQYETNNQLKYSLKFAALTMMVASSAVIADTLNVPPFS